MSDSTSINVRFHDFALKTSWNLGSSSEVRVLGCWPTDPKSGLGTNMCKQRRNAVMRLVLKQKSLLKQHFQLSLCVNFVNCITGISIDLKERSEPVLTQKQLVESFNCDLDCISIQLKHSKKNAVDLKECSELKR